MREMKLRLQVLQATRRLTRAARVKPCHWSQGRHNNVGVTAGNVSHSASNDRGVTAGKMGRNSSTRNEITTYTFHYPRFPLIVHLVMSLHRIHDFPMQDSRPRHWLNLYMKKKNNLLGYTYKLYNCDYSRPTEGNRLPYT